MGYNYDKRWLDSQADTVQLMVTLADRQDEVVYEFDTFPDLENTRRYMRSVLAALSVHYPNFAYVTEKIRTWKEIDRETGAIWLHVGTANNFRAPARQVKTRHGKHAVDAKVRGAKPQPQVVDAKRLLQGVAAQTQTANADEVFPVDDLMTEADAREWLTGAIDWVSKSSTLMVIDCKTTQLSTKFTADLIEELKGKGWTLDDSESTGDTITRLKLRRVGSTQEVHNV